MDYIKAVLSSAKKGSENHLGELIFVGTLGIILGFLAMIFVGISTMLSVIMIGWWFVVGGMFSIYLAFKLKAIGGFWSPFILGILSIVCGVFIVGNPAIEAAFLTLLIAVVLIVTGLTRIIYCFVDDFANKTSVFISGFISIACGWVIYSGWPVSGAWVIGTFVGIDLIFAGATMVSVGLMGKRHLKALAF